MSSLDAVAESYVRLTLAMGEIDPYHVDAYYGPQQWKDEATGKSLNEIIEESQSVRAQISDDLADSDRRARSLAAQLDALIARATVEKRGKYDL